MKNFALLKHYVKIIFYMLWFLQSVVFGTKIKMRYKNNLDYNNNIVKGQSLHNL